MSHVKIVLPDSRFKAYSSSAESTRVCIAYIISRPTPRILSFALCLETARFSEHDYAENRSQAHPL